VFWLLLGIALMTGAAAAVAGLVPGSAALGVWALFCALACLVGAAAIASQPLETSTLAGRLGGLVVRWGFDAAGGRLPGAAAISWLLWCVLGGAVIAFTHGAGDPLRQGMVAAWAADLLGLGFVLAAAAARRGQGTVGALLPPAAVLAGVLVTGAALWMAGARWAALAVTAAPPVLVGGGYGPFVLVILLFGRNARWN